MPGSVRSLPFDGHADIVPVGWHGGYHHGFYGGHGRGWYRGRWWPHAYGWRRPWRWYGGGWLPGYVAWSGPYCGGAPPGAIAAGVLNIVAAVLANRPWAHEVVVEPAAPLPELPLPTPLTPPGANPPPVPPEENYPGNSRLPEVAPLPRVAAAPPLTRREARLLRRQLRRLRRQQKEPPKPVETDRIAVSQRHDPQP